jgi:hypothetical protein
LTFFCLYYLFLLLIDNSLCCFIYAISTMSLHQYNEFNSILMNILRYFLPYLYKIISKYDTLFFTRFFHLSSLWSVQLALLNFVSTCYLHTFLNFLLSACCVCCTGVKVFSCSVWIRHCHKEPRENASLSYALLSVTKATGSVHQDSLVLLSSPFYPYSHKWGFQLPW